MSQPVPPSWKDLGKAANDLLSKDYHLNGTQLEIKTKAPNGVTFKVAGTRDNKTNNIHGDLEGKFSDPKIGLTLTETWTTANEIKTQLELDNQIAKGLKLDLNTTFLPHTSAKLATVSAIYKQSGFNSKLALDLFKGPTFTADAVVGRDGWHLGVEGGYSLPTASITRYAAAIGYAAPEYTVALHGLGNFGTFSASYYHKVNRDVEAGAKAVWDSKSTTGAVAMEVGMKTYLDNAAYVKAKINNTGIVCLGYTQALRPGVKASFGLAIDTQKLSSTSEAHGVPSHKVGAQLTFES